MTSNTVNLKKFYFFIYLFFLHSWSNLQRRRSHGLWWDGAIWATAHFNRRLYPFSRNSEIEKWRATCTPCSRSHYFYFGGGEGGGCHFALDSVKNYRIFFYHLSGVNTKDIKHYSYAVRRQLDLRQCLVPASLDNICDTLPMTWYQTRNAWLDRTNIKSR